MPSDPIQTPVTEEWVDEDGNTVIIGYPNDVIQDVSDELEEVAAPIVPGRPNLPR